MEQHVVPTDKSKFVGLTEDVVCEDTRDVDGQPVVVRVRRLPRITIMPIMRSMPSIAERMDADEAKRKLLEEARKNMSTDQLLREQAGMLAIADRLIVAAAVSPTFSLEVEADRVHVDALTDDDKVLAMDTILRLSNWYTSDEEAEAYRKFRADQRRANTGGDSDAPVPPAETPAPTA